LRIRLTLWYSISLGLILLLFATFLYGQLRRSLLAQVDRGLEVVAAQSLITLDAEDERLAFQPVESDAEAVRQLNDDFVVYLLAPDGSTWDRLGSDDDAPLVTTPAAGYTTVASGDEPWRVYSQPVSIGGTDGWLQVVQELEPVEQTLRSLLAQMLFGVPVAIVLAGIGGFFLASRALRPMDRITRTAQAIHADDLRQRIGYTGPADEIGRLAATLDNMLARLQTAFERERRFTGDAAHELRTPLAALKGRIGVTLSQPRHPSAYVKTLQEMEQQVDRLVRLSNDLLFMARLDQGQPHAQSERIDLGDFLGAIIDQVRPLAEAKAIHLIERIPPGIVIQGQMDLLIRLFLNLLDNAVKYTPVNGQVTVQAQKQAYHVRIEIRDTGPGIAASYLPHLFERFYRVEDDRSRHAQDNGHRGAGLGLAIAHEIVRAHGGTLSVQSEEGEGTIFFVQLLISAGTA
ncbi:MAG: sensor histidine kinase, partial [Ardenticatenaceae bacterium]